MTRYDSTSSHARAVHRRSSPPPLLVVRAPSLLPNRRRFGHTDPVIVETGVLVATAVPGHLAAARDLPSDRAQIGSLTGGES